MTVHGGGAGMVVDSRWMHWPWLEGVSDKSDKSLAGALFGGPVKDTDGIGATGVARLVKPTADWSVKVQEGSPRLTVPAHWWVLGRC